MRLVIDANILVAALLKEATSREILLEEDIEFFAPEQLLSEIRYLLKNPKIRKRLPLNNKDLSDLSTAIFSRIKFVPEKLFLPIIGRSVSLVKHPEDAPYVGLALALKIPLWSNDLALKQQSVVPAYTTSELVRMLKEG